MDILISINSNLDDEYRIKLSPFDFDLLPKEINNISCNNIEIADITLEKVSGNSSANLGILLKISNIIAEIFEDNKNLILYFYCDDMHDVLRRNMNITQQKYRSKLFSRMFDKYIASNHITNIINTPIEIKADRDIYIHLIARDSHLNYVDMIKETLIEMESK
jgi:hypothetical protein